MQISWNLEVHFMPSQLYSFVYLYFPGYAFTMYIQIIVQSTYIVYKTWTIPWKYRFVYITSLIKVTHR